MAKIVLAKVVGGSIQEVKDVETVKQVREKLGLGTDHTAMVGGQTAEDSTRLREEDYVTFAKATKGGK